MHIVPDFPIQTIGDFPGKWIDHVVSSPVSGALVASVGKNAIVFKDGGETHRFEHPSSVGGLALDAKGRRLAASHYGGVTLRYALMADDKGVALKWAGSHLDVTISPDADYVVSAMQENSLHGWRLPEKTDLRMSGYSAKTRSLLVGQTRAMARNQRRGPRRGVAVRRQTRPSRQGAAATRAARSVGDGGGVSSE